MSKQSVNWIPCKEKLPDESNRYYITQKEFSIEDLEHKGNYKLTCDYASFSVISEQWSRAKQFEVIAWMPNEPYQPEKE